MNTMLKRLLSGRFFMVGTFFFFTVFTEMIFEYYSAHEEEIEMKKEQKL